MKPTNLKNVARKSLPDRILDIANKLSKDEGFTSREVADMLGCHHRSVNEAAKKIKSAIILYPAGCTTGRTYIVNPKEHAKEINQQSKS